MSTIPMAGKMYPRNAYAYHAYDAVIDEYFNKPLKFALINGQTSIMPKSFFPGVKKCRGHLTISITNYTSWTWSIHFIAIRLEEMSSVDRFGNEDDRPRTRKFRSSYKVDDRHWAALDTMMSELPGLKICAACKRTATNYCKHCKAVYYCSFICQFSDFDNHKNPCWELRQALAETVQVTIAASFLFDLGTTTTFCQCVDVLIALYLTKFSTAKSVKEAAFFGINRLVRANSSRLVDRLPELLLRIGMDQAAFNFIQWSEDCQLEKDAHPELPCVLMETLDRSSALRPTAPADKMSVYHAYAYALILYRLYRELLDMQHIYTLILVSEHALSDRSMVSLIKLVNTRDALYHIRSYLVPKNYAAYAEKDAYKILRHLHSFMYIRECLNHPLIWKNLIKPRKDVSDLYLAAQFCLPSWKLTKGALQHVRSWLHSRERY